MYLENSVVHIIRKPGNGLNDRNGFIFFPLSCSADVVKSWRVTLLLGTITEDRRTQMSADSYDFVPTERISLIVMSVSINGCYRRVVR